MNETLTNNLMMIMFWGLLLLFTATPVASFVPLQQPSNALHNARQQESLSSLVATPSIPKFGLSVVRESESNDQGDEEEDDGEKKENPYSDPNYPDLEFVNYDDPDYNVDQGDEYFDETSTEEQVEEMREDRRRRNDEYQFQTYFKELLKEGKEYKGDWSVYQTSTFLEEMRDKGVLDASGFPKLLKSSSPLYVISTATKSTVECDSEFPTDAERIYHKQSATARPDLEEDDDEVVSKAEGKANKAVLESLYWPKEMSALDFRGEKGIMCVGNSYTICTSVPLVTKADDSEANLDDVTDGPFSEYRAEMGILFEELRFRVKLDYRVKDDDKEAYLKSTSDSKSSSAPKLCLKSMVICREALERWPQGPATDGEHTKKDSLYGTPGSAGGLYDPPPVGDEDQAGKYMLLDLEGGATLLFPHEMEQKPTAFEGNGWVTSLDWTPGRYRYQVDRKIKGGIELRNLRTLELSEVQGDDADEYRPRDGGEDMRQ